NTRAPACRRRTPRPSRTPAWARPLERKRRTPARRSDAARPRRSRRPMIETAGWLAPAATMIAAMMTAANLGARVTGWGFVVFTVGSIGWCAIALSTGQQNLLWTNGFLTLVNGVGIWRWLGRKARYEAGGKSAEVRS